jgi:uncharacterized protein YbjT (DUF2867 family)
MGATGLVGSELLPLLLESDRYARVIVLLRASIDMTHPKLEQRVVDFEALPVESPFYACDDLFITFGTTMAKAGTKSRFETIDLVWPLHVATKAREAGCKQLMLVSALGASSASSIFYSRTKGRLEDEVRKLRFASLHIFQPGVLLGKRQEPRPAEALAAFFFGLAEKVKPGIFGKYSGMHVDQLARAMLMAATCNHKGMHTHTWPSIAQLLTLHRLNDKTQ